MPAARSLGVVRGGSTVLAIQIWLLYKQKSWKVDWLLYKQESWKVDQYLNIQSSYYSYLQQEKADWSNLEWRYSSRVLAPGSCGSSTVLATGGGSTVPATDHAVAVRCQRRSHMVAVQCQRRVQGSSTVLAIQIQGSSTVLAVWIWSSSTMLATGIQTNAGRKAGLERRLKKKTGLDILKTLHGESAIALHYRQCLAGGASNPNIIKTIYYMRMLDE